MIPHSFSFPETLTNPGEPMNAHDKTAGRTDEPPGLLGRRYLAALALVALLQLLNQVIIQPPILKLMTDPPTINLAGRQRMLSQRIAKSALALAASRDEEESRRRRQELTATLGLWSHSHERLTNGPPSGPFPMRKTREIRKAFAGLQPFYVRMRDASSRLLADDDCASLAVILAAESEYLPRMDRIVGLYEREAQAHVNWLSGTGWGVTAMILIALVGIGAFVVRPATDLIERQVAELRRSRDDLEARVRERTRALARLNHDLAREVAERARAEETQRALVEQISHVARTKAVGEMAGGLAHELNQPLGAIANYAEGCLVALDSPDPPVDEVRAVLGKILTTTMRAGAIVQSILRFVTRHGTAQEEFDPNRLVLDTEGFFRDEIRRRGTSLRVELAPDLPKLVGDPVQVQQVLVNLLRNALDALNASQPVNPTVIIATESITEGDVGFRVSDNGEGIPGDRIGQIFDAYFSTREQGMGMGLAICRTIVEAHHGRISVESEPGVRTTFRFTIPAAGDGDDGA